MQQIYRRTPTPKCDFNKVALLKSHLSAWVFSCKFAAYFQNTFLYEHIWRAGFEWTYFLQNVVKQIFRYSDFIFSGRKSQGQQKLARKIIQNTTQFRSKHHIHFTNLISLHVQNNILPKRNQKPFSLYKFPSKHVFIWCQKNSCTALFLNTQESHF